MTETKDTMSITVEEAARKLASFHAEQDSSLVAIYWFPAEDEVRLVDVDPSAMPYEDAIYAYMFPPDAAHGVPFPSGLAVVTPEEFEKLDPPPGWGSRERAVKVWARES